MRTLQHPAATRRAETITVGSYASLGAGVAVAGLLAAAALGLPGTVLAPAQAAAPALPAVALPSPRPKAAPVINLPLAPVAARKFASFAPGSRDAAAFRQLNGYYVGKARAPRVRWSNVDLAQNVRLMWQRKAATFTVTPATVKAVDGIVARYAASPRQLTTLPQHVARVEQVVGRARAGLDYPALCAAYKLGSDRCVRLQYLSAGITGRMLTAYSMTEVMPSHSGQQNAYLMDMMLRKVGVDFLNATPALGDALLSMGPYQFTSFAVRHDSDGRQGASVVAKYGTYRLPGSVAALSPEDQHVAAFYFATFNLLRLVRNLSPQEFAVLKRKAPLGAEDLTTFMATSHHAPVLAQRAARAWLAGGCKGRLAAHQRGRLTVYAKKSTANLRALG